MTGPTVAMICHFPPPVHGAALVSECVRERFIREGFRVISINTAPKGLRRNLGYYFARIWGFCGVLLLLRLGRDDIIYCSVNARWGVINDLVIALIARMVGAGLWHHHHSFYYLERPSLLHAVTFRVNRRQSTHIVLCETMRTKILQAYGVQSGKVHVLSNVNFVAPVTVHKAGLSDECANIGFFSNISEEKGISDFLILCDRMRDLPVEFQIAGPIVDKKYDWIRDLEITPILVGLANSTKLRSRHSRPGWTS